MGQSSMVKGIRIFNQFCHYDTSFLSLDWSHIPPIESRENDETGNQI